MIKFYKTITASVLLYRCEMYAYMEVYELNQYLELSSKKMFELAQLIHEKWAKAKVFASNDTIQEHHMHRIIASPGQNWGRTGT